MLIAMQKAIQKMSRPSKDMVASAGSPRPSASALLIGSGTAETSTRKTVHATPSNASARKKLAVRRRNVNLTMVLSGRGCAAGVRRSRNSKLGCAAVSHNAAHARNVHLQVDFILGRLR